MDVSLRWEYSPTGPPHAANRPSTILSWWASLVLKLAHPLPYEMMHYYRFSLQREKRKLKIERQNYFSFRFYYCYNILWMLSRIQISMISLLFCHHYQHEACRHKDVCLLGSSGLPLTNAGNGSVSPVIASSMNLEIRFPSLTNSTAYRTCSEILRSLLLYLYKHRSCVSRDTCHCVRLCPCGRHECVYMRISLCQLW
jgi:hypothetical protein